MTTYRHKPVEIQAWKINFDERPPAWAGHGLFLKNKETGHRYWCRGPEVQPVWDGDWIIRREWCGQDYKGHSGQNKWGLKVEIVVVSEEDFHHFFEE